MKTKTSLVTIITLFFILCTFLLCVNSYSKTLDFTNRDFDEVINSYYWKNNPHECIELKEREESGNQYIKSLEQGRLIPKSIFDPVFHCSVSFFNAKFNNHVNFDSVTFYSSVNFREATFDSITSFQYTNFFLEANYSSIDFNQLTDFSNTNFLSSVDFSDVSFNNIVVFRHNQFGSSVDFIESTFRSQVYLFDVDFKSRADFSNVTFDSLINFSYSNFSSLASFREATFKDQVSFLNVRLPEKLDFRSIETTKEIDLLSCLQPLSGSKCKLALFGADIDMLLIKPEKFELWFPPYTIWERNKKGSKNEFIEVGNTYDDTLSVYESLLKNLRNNGFMESYEKLDIELKEIKYKHSGLLGRFIKNPFQRLWWNYGYNSERVFLIMISLLIIFTILNYLFFYAKLNTEVYRIPFLSKSRIPALWSIKRFILSFIQVLTYTSIVFFGLKMNISDFSKGVTKKHPRLFSYLMFIYTSGLFCLGYVVNIIFTK